jgi:hypothetical protein
MFRPGLYLWLAEASEQATRNVSQAIIDTRRIISTAVDLAAYKCAAYNAERNGPCHILPTAGSSATSTAQDATDDGSFDATIVVYRPARRTTMHGEWIFMDDRASTAVTGDLFLFGPSTDTTRIAGCAWHVLFSINLLKALIAEPPLTCAGQSRKWQSQSCEKCDCC